MRRGGQMMKLIVMPVHREDGEQGMEVREREREILGTCQASHTALNSIETHGHASEQHPTAFESLLPCRRCSIKRQANISFFVLINKIANNQFVVRCEMLR
jgi:hypothetical protein